MLGEPRLHFGGRPRLRGVGEERRQRRVGVGRREPGRGEALVVEPRPAQRGLHRTVEGRVIVPVNRVQGDPHGDRADHRAVAVGLVEGGGLDAVDAVPQGEVRRGRMLRLQRDQAAHGLTGAEGFPA